MSSGETPGGQPPTTTATTTATNTIINQCYYFCHECNRTITLSSPTNLTCPRCNGSFLEEVDLPSPPSFPPLPLPFLSSDFAPFHPVDFSSLFSPAAAANLPTTATTTAVFDPFTFLHNYLHSMRSGGANVQLVLDNPTASLGDYFFGPGLEQLIQQLAENDPNRYGTPPASKKVVEGLPIVVLNEEMFRNENSQCAVCMDEFDVGGKAIEMPCKHFFHKDCIVPWLELHNSCPVCRYELPTDDPDYEQRGRSSDGGEGESSAAGGGGDGVVERRFRISLPLPFLGSAAGNSGGGGGENAGFGSGTRQEDLD